MSHRPRLQPFADVVKAAGLRGDSMQGALRKVAEAHDLNAHEIRRVAEIANRDVQLNVLKTAGDKRVKFELADPFALTGELQKTAGELRPASEAEKIAALTYAGGDPFKAPELPVGPGDLSVYREAANADPAIALQAELTKLAETRSTLQAAYSDTERMLEEANMMGLEHNSAARGAYDRMVADAVELVLAGITVPSLYETLYQSVAGPKATDDERQYADDLMLQILRGLKEKGVPNHRLGFRYKADVNGLDALGVEDLLTLCKNSLGCRHGTITMADTKTAARLLEATAIQRDLDPGQHLFDEAGAWMNTRPAIVDYQVPQAFLDDTQTENRTGPRLRVLNGDSEFVVAVRDFRNATNGLAKSHNAAEYLGLQLKRVGDALEENREAREKVSGVMSLLKKGSDFMSGSHGNALTNAANVAGGALGAAASVQQIQAAHQEAARAKKQDAGQAQPEMV